MGIFEHVEFSNHEQVIVCSNADSGLKSIIAIHDTTLGPAAGGCRLYPYPDTDSAMTDVLRLSKAMTYKNALAGLPLGGGKSVIICDPSQKTPALLAAFARFVRGLGGTYWTAEDINIGPADAEILAGYSQYVFGLTHGGVGSGDPSPFTAGGCLEGMRAALQHVFGTDTLTGRHFAIQGVGNVGYALAKLIAAGGGKLTVADPSPARIARVQRDFGVRVVPVEDIYSVKCDVFAPCAMGGTINSHTIPHLDTKIVCGVANNQLGAPRDGADLLARNITYAPDYVVNAGGMHNASADIFGRYDVDDIWRRIRGIRDITSRLLDEAAREERPTSEIADALAREIIARGQERKRAKSGTRIETPSI